MRHKHRTTWHFTSKSWFWSCTTTVIVQEVIIPTDLWIDKDYDVTRNLNFFFKYVSKRKINYYFNSSSINYTHIFLQAGMFSLKFKKMTEKTEQDTEGMPIHTLALPSTANTRVFVKCLYRDSLMTFLRSLSVRVVWTRLLKTHQQMAASTTDRGIIASMISLDRSNRGYNSKLNKN